MSDDRILSAKVLNDWLSEATLVANSREWGPRARVALDADKILALLAHIDALAAEHKMLRGRIIALAVTAGEARGPFGLPCRAVPSEALLRAVTGADS